MAAPPALPAGLTPADYAVLRRVLAKLDRWYTPASGVSSPAPRSVSVQASGTTGTGVGTALCYANPNRVGLLIFSPTAAVNLYISTVENFGVVAGAPTLSTQYGMFFAAGTYLSFGQEYVGPIYAYNAALPPGTLDVRVLELFGDPAVTEM